MRGNIIGERCPVRSPRRIRQAYGDLAACVEREDPDVAVRSAATAEDPPEESFAGHLETFLNIRGETALIDAVRRCFASLFTDHAIPYRRENGFDHMGIALSAGVQKMARPTSPDQG